MCRISKSEEFERFIAGRDDADRMEQRPFKDECKLLWYGSRGCSFGGIFSQGLRIAFQKHLKMGRHSESIFTWQTVSANLQPM